MFVTKTAFFTASENKTVIKGRGGNYPLFNGNNLITNWKGKLYLTRQELSIFPFLYRRIYRSSNFRPISFLTGENVQTNFSLKNLFSMDTY